MVDAALDERSGEDAVGPRREPVGEPLRPPPERASGGEPAPPAPDAGIDEEDLPAAYEDEGPRVGDVTVIPFARVREQVGCGAEAGILLEDRRSVVKVLFPGMDRTFWLERDRVRTVALERIPVHPLVARLHRIARLVSADTIEEYDQRDGVAVFHVFCGALDAADLLRVRDALGDDLVRFRVEPGGVRRLRLHVAFRVPSPTGGRP